MDELSHKDLSLKIKRTGEALQGILVDSDDLGRPGEMTREGIQKLSEWEGLKIYPYDDATGTAYVRGTKPHGYPTIGVGHKLTTAELASGKINIEEREVSWANGLSRRDCIILLAQDLDPVESTVWNSLNGAIVSPRGFDSLVSLCFNIGSFAFRHGGPNGTPCKPLRALHAGNIAGVAPGFMAWNKTKIDGKRVVSDGLIWRRAKEIEYGGWPT